MASSKVIIVTGASRGMGLAMANYLVKAGHKVVLVARNAEPMLKLELEYPEQVLVVPGDLADLSLPEEAVTAALERFSQVDGLIANHSMLGEVRRIADCSVEDWRTLYDVNFFSTVAFVKAVIPSLRNSRGKIILVSSGAAVTAYSTWGAYGSSKAAINHLAITLKAEEPMLTTVAIRPGVIDTEMQKEIRERHRARMDRKDVIKYSDLHLNGELLLPEQPGHVIAKLALNAPEELGGKFLSWNDMELASFQEMKLLEF